MAISFSGTAYRDTMEFLDSGVSFGVLPMTMSVWVNTNTVASNRTFFTLAQTGLTTGTSSGYCLRHDNRGTVQVIAAQVNGGNTYPAGGDGISLTAGKWSHVVMVSEGSGTQSTSRRVFVDGAQSATAGTTPRNILNVINNALVGHGVGSTYLTLTSFNGKVAEAAVWNAALTADDITALARGALPTSIKPNNLRFYAPLARDEFDYSNDSSTRLQVSGADAASPSDHPRLFQ